MYYLLSIPMLAINKFPPFPIYINLLYLSIFTISLYLIGKELFGNIAGIFAASIPSAIPIIIQSRRTYLLDFPVNAMIALTCLFIVKSKGFSIIKYSILSGVFTALSILTKQFAALFIFPFILANFTVNNYKIKPNLKLLGLFIVAFLILLIPYFLVNSSEIFKLFSDLQKWADVEKNPQGFTVESFRFYYDQFIYQYSLIIRLLVGISSILLLIKKENSKKLFTLWAAIVGSYILLSMNPNKDPRYSEPFVIFIAIIIAGGISSIQNSIIRRSLSSILMSYCIFSLLTLTIGWPTLNIGKYYPNPIEPSRYDWKVKQVLTDLKPEITTQATMLIIPDHPYVNCVTYGYYARLYKISLFTPCPQIIPTIVNFNDMLTNSNYVMIIDNVTSMKYMTPIYNYVVEGYKIFESEKLQFVQIHQYSLPEGLSLIVYKRL